MIEDLLSKLAVNPLFIVLCSVVTLLAFIFGFIFYHKSKKYKSLSYTLNTFNLLNEKLKGVEGLEVIYNTTQVSNLSVTELSFWNSGTETIEGSDIAERNKLTILPKDNVYFLDTKILNSNNGSKGIKLSPDCSVDGLIASLSVNIDFDFLNPQEGMTIQLYHTGTSSADIKLTGAIKGIKSLHRVVNENEFIIEYVEAEDGYSSFLNKYPISRIIIGLILIFGCFFRAFVVDVTNTKTDYTLIFVLLSLAVYHIRTYLRNKKNTLPSWIKKKQTSPMELEVA